MIEIKRWGDITEADIERYFNRSGEILSEINARVAEIMQAVEMRGDAALVEFTERFDGVRLAQLRVTAEEVAAAYKQVDESFVAAFKQALANSRAFEASTFPLGEKVSTQPGIEVWREWRPIERVGLYIPGGKARYPSSLLMTAVPAKLAGCPEFVVCTPPDSSGQIPAVTLVACDLCGVDQIYKLGGAQAIAAMTYGTESVPAVYKIFGAGNTYVTAAKLQAFGRVDIDMPAGPSEILILADDSANPAFLAADLLSQAEHGPDSASVLVTDSPRLAEQVQAEVEQQLTALATAENARTSIDRYGLIVLVEDLVQGAEVANRYAPEHLEIVTREDDRYLAMIGNVGSVFLGAYAPEPAGDYATGSNHVLPTNGYARMFNPLSVESFGRKIQVQRLTREGLAGIRTAVATLADAEGLPAHKRAVEIRFAEESS